MERSRYARGLTHLLCLLGCLCSASVYASTPPRPTSRPAKAAPRTPPTKAAKATAKATTKALEGSVEKLLASREYERALLLLQDKKAMKDQPLRLYLLGRAYMLQKKYKDAVKVSLGLAKTYPKSRYKAKALLQAADALSKMRKYDKAQALYAAQIALLLSRKRRIAIAAVYLRLARKYAKKRPGKSVRYSKSILFYKKALGLTLPEPQRRQVVLELASLYYKYQQRSWRSHYFLKATVKRYPKGVSADVFKFMLAHVMMKRGQRGTARRMLQDILVDFPKSKKLPRAFLLLAQTYRLPGVTSARELTQGIKVLHQMLKRFPKHEESRRAAFWITTTYYYNGRYDKAIQHARAFIASFATAKAGKVKQRYVALARYRIAQCYMAQKRYDKAIAAFQAFLQAHPTDRDWPQAQRQIISARYSKAQGYMAQKKWALAKQAFTKFLQQYPIDTRNAGIMWFLGQMEAKQKHPKAAIAAWQQLVSKYPQHRRGRQAKWDIARTYETKLHDYARALTAYRAIKYYRFRRRALAALRRLTNKSLAVLTPKTFTTKDAPFIEASARNIKTLHVRMYKIDPETYYRKMRRFTGMNKLDIELIRPDKSWDVKVPKFRKHHLHKVKIALPSKSPMVAVYHVSGGKLAATTVAIVSDLQILTKVTRRSLFVFGFNSTKRTPLGGVRLLISDGKKILHVGKTDARGVFQRRFKSLRKMSQLRVLALAGRSVAASENALAGIGYSQGVQVSGVVYTDRPVYRPGETVFVRSIVREVKGGVYQLPTKPYHMDISGPGGRVLFRRKQKASAFGTLRMTFPTDPSTPQSWYRIRVWRKGGGAFIGRFRVAAYKLPKFHVALKMKRKVVQRRHRIKGHVSVRYGFGAPAANKLVRITLSSQKIKGRTNAKGQLAFSFKTRDLVTDRRYVVRAQMLGERPSARGHVWLRSTMFDLGMSTVRKVYAAGEAFEVKLKAADPAGKAHAANVMLRWFRLSRVHGRQVETKVGEQEVKVGQAGATKGTGAATIQIKKGGTYRLRATTTDADKQPVSAQYQLFIAGDDDKQSLRLLADKDHAQVGDTVQVKLLVRKQGLALLTYESDQVLYHRLIPTLKKGEMRIPIKITDAMSPNFALRVALLHKQKLYTVEKHFLISKKLKLSVKIKEKDLRPGGWATLVIQARDQRGKGVKAEVSVAMVNRALFALFKDRTPKLGDVFYAYRRKLGQSTSASHSYSHKAVGSRISAAMIRLQTRPTGSSVLGRFMQNNQQRRRRSHWHNKRKRRMFYRGRRNRINNPGLQSQNGQIGNLLGMDGLGNRNLNGGLGDQLQGMNKEQMLVSELHKRLFTKGLRRRFATTAYWNPSVVTDKKGRASVRVRLPDNAATWKIWLRGVALPTLVGETSSTCKSSKAFLATLRLPGVLTDGDAVRPGAVLHNRTAKPLKAKVTLLIKGLGVKHLMQVSIPAKSSRALLFPALQTKDAGGRIVQVKLAATAHHAGVVSPLSDAVARSLTIRTPGIQVYASRAGTSDGTSRATLTLPGRGPFLRQMIKVSVGPLSPQWLVDLATRSASTHGFTQFFPGTIVYRAAITERVLRYLKGQGLGKTPAAKRLRIQLAGMTRSLWAQQQRKGGWIFVGKDRYASDEWLFSAQVFSVLARAYFIHGLFAPAKGLKRARRYVKKGYHKTFSVRAKATIVAALALMPAQDQHELFSYANRLYRSRTKLGLEALTQLGFGLVALQRPHLAKHLVKYIEARIKAGGAKVVRHKKLVALPFVAQIALAAELLAELAPTSALRQATVMVLLEKRRGLAWPSLLLTSRALGALAAHYGRVKRSQTKLKLTLRYNGKVVKTIALTAKTPTFVWKQFLGAKQTGHKVVIEADGLGKYQYAMSLVGFTRFSDKKLRSRYVKVTRKYAPAYRQMGGRSFSPGFGVVRGVHKKWKRTVKKLPVGDHTRVSINLWRRAKDFREDLVVDEAIPGGTFVLPTSVVVPRGRFQILPGRIRFFLHHSARSWHIRYQLYGTRPGRYLIPATQVYSFADPGRLSLGSHHTLTVLPANTKQRPSYRMTPNELLNMGEAHFKAGRKDKARRLLAALVDGFKLREYGARKAAKMLLKIAFAKGPEASIVRFFEMRKELDPDAILPFGEIVKVGRAYAVQKEFERATQVYQATLQAHFLNVLQVAGALEREGEFTTARKFIEKLLWAYPDMKSLKEAAYGLAQTAYQQATKHRSKAKVFSQWLGHTERLLRQFVMLYPDHPSADTAAYTRANVMLDQKRKQDAIRYLSVLAKRYPMSNELDSIHYLHAYALYLRRKSKEALALLQQVSTQRYPTTSGGRQRSKHRHLATYLIAQLHHANSHLALALQWYQKVRKRFADAAAQVRHFKRVQLVLPEVTTIGAKATATLKVVHQNIKRLRILAYRVDLMKLYVHKKNLNAVTKINLAGIRPTYRGTHVLGKGPEFNSRTTKLTLPLPKRGAYLIVLKSAEREVSGILLRTRLKLEVQQDVASGRVTAYLLRRRTRTPAAYALTRVNGSAASKMRSGKTDLRGIYSTENIKGYATIIAQVGDDFAFFRGKLDLQRSRKPKPRRSRKFYNFDATRVRGQRKMQMMQKKISPAPKMLEHINRGNEFNMSSGRRQMLDLYKKSQKGVQMKYLK